jgi:dihydrofolate reductase
VEVESASEDLVQKAEAEPGEPRIGVAGPELAGQLTRLGQIDAYRLYLSPAVLGAGKPFFSGPRPSLHPCPASG